MSKKFVVSEKFKVGYAYDGSNRIKIGYIEDKFNNCFGLLTEEIEEDPPMVLNHILEKDSSDKEIIKRIGGEERAKVKITSIWKWMAASCGVSGLFYVIDSNGVLCTVRALYIDDSYYVYTDPVSVDDDSHKWQAGYSVFTYNL